MKSVTIIRVRRNFYQDSLRLMQISRRLRELAGVVTASAVMATDANLKMLGAQRLLSEDVGALGPNDLLVTIEADSRENADRAAETIDLLEASPIATSHGADDFESLDAAAVALRAPNLALVSVPGMYAKIEVAKAIERGMHTFLFSDNVPVEEEIELKERAASRDLLVMGPECGTAIINGVGLGFANVVRRGPVGIVAAAGTGLQEVASLIHRGGAGISHAIGIGGRDLSRSVGGIMAAQALRLLLRDSSTRVVLLVSKPPDDSVARNIVSLLLAADKPAVVCFVGKTMKSPAPERLHFSATLHDAAQKAVELLGYRNHLGDLSPDGSIWRSRAQKLAKALAPRQRYVRGLFSGGTLCYEAQHVLWQRVRPVYSNAPLFGGNKLDDPNRSRGHCVVDLGHEEFTHSRLHPMIDSSMRAERLLKEAIDPTVAVILFDIVLGYVAAPDPAGDLVAAIKEATITGSRRGRKVAFVAHVCGTDEDPQNLTAQEEKLESAGVLVLATNALAAETAAWIATRGAASIASSTNKYARVARKQRQAKSQIH